MILALDLGTKTGVAYGAPGARPRLETWVMPAGGGADVGPYGCAFEDRLVAALDEVSVLAFEAPFVGPKMLGNMHTTRRLIGPAYECVKHAHRRGIKVIECNIMTVKRDFAGHGRADKSAMIRSARMRGFEPANEHEADAAGCWVYAVGKLRTEPHLYDPLFAQAARSD